MTLTSSPPVTEVVTDFASRVKAGSGLTTPGAVFIGATLLSLGASVDLLIGDALGVAFGGTFLIASVAMALTLRVRALSTAVTAPPLLFTGVTAVATKASGQVDGSRALALDTATSLALSAPVLFGGTALAAGIAVVRLVREGLRRRGKVRH